MDNKNKKFFLVYTIVLFGIAILLIVMSSIRHEQDVSSILQQANQQVTEQVTITKGFKDDLDKIIVENEEKKIKIDELEEKIAEKDAEIKELQEKIKVLEEEKKAAEEATLKQAEAKKTVKR